MPITTSTSLARAAAMIELPIKLKNDMTRQTKLLCSTASVRARSTVMPCTFSADTSPRPVRHALAGKVIQVAGDNRHFVAAAQQVARELEVARAAGVVRRNKSLMDQQ